MSLAASSYDILTPSMITSLVGFGGGEEVLLHPETTPTGGEDDTRETGGGATCVIATAFPVDSLRGEDSAERITGEEGRDFEEMERTLI